MNPLNLFKTAVEITVSVGVGAVVGNAIKASTPAGTHVVKRVAIGVGALVLSSMVGDMATKYATDTIDETAGKIKNLIKPTPIEEVQEEPELVATEEVA